MSSANVAVMAETTPDATRLAAEARDRVRFEEEALQLSDQVFRVARRLTGSREEAEDLVQDTYARAFRAWTQYQPGTNLRSSAPAVHPPKASVWHRHSSS